MVDSSWPARIRIKQAEGEEKQMEFWMVLGLLVIFYLPGFN